MKAQTYTYQEDAVGPFTIVCESPVYHPSTDALCGVSRRAHVGEYHAETYMYAEVLVERLHSEYGCDPSIQGRCYCELSFDVVDARGYIVGDRRPSESESHTDDCISF